MAKKLSEIYRSAIIAAIGFVIALSWNEAIKLAFKEAVLPKIPVPGTGYIYQIFIAIIVTFIGGIAIWLLSRK